MRDMWEAWTFEGSMLRPLHSWGVSIIGDSLEEERCGDLHASWTIHGVLTEIGDFKTARTRTTMGAASRWYHMVGNHSKDVVVHWWRSLEDSERQGEVSNLTTWR